MSAGRGVNELAGDPNKVATSADAAFEDVTHPQLAANLLYVKGPSLVGKARIAGDDKQARETGQGGDDLFHDAISEILLSRVVAHALKRQDGDGRLVGDDRTRPGIDLTDGGRSCGLRTREPVASARYGEHIGLAILSVVEGLSQRRNVDLD